MSAVREEAQDSMLDLPNTSSLATHSGVLIVHSVVVLIVEIADKYTHFESE
jgi:hypothetical protein